MSHRVRQQGAEDELHLRLEMRSCVVGAGSKCAWRGEDACAGCSAPARSCCGGATGPVWQGTGGKTHCASPELSLSSRWLEPLFSFCTNWQRASRLTGELRIGFINRSRVRLMRRWPIQSPRHPLTSQPASHSVNNASLSPSPFLAAAASSLSTWPHHSDPPMKKQFPKKSNHIRLLIMPRDGPMPLNQKFHPM